MEHTVDDTAKAILALKLDDDVAVNADGGCEHYMPDARYEPSDLQTLAQHWLDTHTPKLYVCTRCEVEYDTCLELNSFKINDVEHSICADCLRKWLGEEKV